MTSRLDILLYGHDGRGLGHASRSIGIGMALRRLYPHLKTVLVTGTPFATELIDKVPLDWLKLPAYATTILDGRSRGTDGLSNYTDKELGQLRAKTLQQIVKLYRPRLILCDHSPLGKHRELLPAQQTAEDCQWILGVRAIVGAVPQVFSEMATQIFHRHFKDILWYGDAAVLGSSPMEELERQFHCAPVPCGYVSRLGELAYWQKQSQSKEKPYAGTVAIPWLGEDHSLVENLARALEAIDPEYGPWNVFIGRETDQDGNKPSERFTHLSHVSMHPTGRGYARSLARSKTALIYGGYNSITDILKLHIPAVVLLRPMQDEEQQLHLQHITRHTGNQLRVLSEQTASAEALKSTLIEQLALQPLLPKINLNGAETAAHRLAAVLRE